MFSNNLDNSMKKAIKYENLTKASKFGNIKNSKDNKKSVEKEILMLQKISKYVKDDYTKNIQKESKEQKEVSEYTKQQKDAVSFCDSIKKESVGLPFFRSISNKLSEEFCV